MSLSAVTSEAILFFDHRGISKSMLYADFEAILDGMVGVPEFADKEVRGAYCLVNGQLKVRSLVLFTIDFDEDGMADTTWNVPLRHLAEHGGQGPDMGAGPIRLACRSQCPVAWHQDQLWDPSMKPGANDFLSIRDTIRERGPKMGLEMDDNLDTSAPTVPVLDASAPTIAPEEDTTRKKADEERVRLARIIKELRLRVQTLENSQSEEAAKLRYAAQQKEEILNAQLEKVMGQFKALKSQNGALREQNDSLKAQILSLNHSLEEQSRRSQDQGSELEVLTEQYKLALEQRLEEERAKLSEDIHAKEMDILTRDDVINQLKEEIGELKRNQMREANSGAQKVLEKLEDLGLSFIAFHPGAGHISIPADQISSYMENPVAFAARKCLVTEDHYRAWLAHYENPVCQVPVGAEKQACGKRVIRVEVPNQFKPGVSDCNANRCPHCRNDSAIDNVLRFR
ncbi:MAG: chromosome partitioning protein ParA [Pseudomonadales bacterium]|nr:chromosome partitioning protein ParA [Pseudomonadales bacterium]